MRFEDEKMCAMVEEREGAYSMGWIWAMNG